VDALPPDILRQLIRNAIGQHMPERELQVLQVAEQSERDLMLRIAGHLPKIEKLRFMNHGS
jgi:hypothetical protein